MSRFLKIRSSIVISLVTLLSLVGCGPGPKDNATTLVRIGWQVPWATQGQITQVLAHTNILERNGLSGEFKGFTYGGPLNEAALAGEVDVIFTADQPAATLLAAGGDWLIIGRLMYNRVAIYVPPESAIQSVADLRGKTIAIPFGAAAQRDALKAIQEAGLDPAKDVTSINLDIYEQTSVVQSGTRQKWEKFDAMVGFDPTPAIFEHEGQARMLHVGKVVSLVLMSQDFISKQPQAPKRFLRAFTEAYFYYATHQEQANNWFKEASKLTFDTAVLDIAAAVEPNIKASSIRDVRITLTEEDLKVMGEAAEFIYKQGLIKNAVNMRDRVNMSYAEEVTKDFKAENYDPNQVKVTLP